MKTLFRVLVLGIFLTAIGILSGIAQEQDCGDLAACFEKFKAQSKPADCGKRDAALVTGKTIVEKFGNDELNKDIIEFVKKRMAAIERDDPRCKLNLQYDDDFKTKNWPSFLAVSKKIIAAEGDTPLALDVMLTSVSIGFDRAAVDKNDTFNADTLNYAKMALQKMDAGKTSKTGKWGVFVPFNTKENAQSWMNNIIGYLMYEKMNQKKEALPYFYKATQLGTENKSDVSIYVKIGNNYFDEASALYDQYRTARAADKANNIEDTDATKKLLGLARGYADRAIDAFGRARKIAVENKAKQTAIDALVKTLGDLYKFRFNLAPDAKTPDMENYVAGFLTKPMPDPSTEVTPVIEEVKPTTTTTTTPTPTPTKPTTTTTKPTPTTTKTKPATSTTTGTTEATTTKTAVKKPVTKKKGTR